MDRIRLSLGLRGGIHGYTRRGLSGKKEGKLLLLLLLLRLGDAWGFELHGLLSSSAMSLVFGGDGTHVGFWIFYLVLNSVFPSLTNRVLPSGVFFIYS